MTPLTSMGLQMRPRPIPLRARLTSRRHLRRARYGKDFTTCKAKPPVEVLDAQLQPLQALRSPARVLPQVRAVLDLSAQHRARGHDPGRQEVELVGQARC